MEKLMEAGEQAGLPVILLVEDNPDDVLLARRALKKAELPVALQVASDGDEAVGYLGAGGRPAHLSLILLDLKLPKRSGLEVLRWIRAQGDLASTPVVVLTSSGEHEDIHQAYALGANSYLQMPVAFNGLGELLGILGLYWLQHNLTGSRTTGTLIAARP